MFATIQQFIGWAAQVNYTVKKAWKAQHFNMRMPIKGNRNTKSLAYISLVLKILEYVAACSDLYREGQIIALDRLKTKRTNLQIIRIVRTRKIWRRLESYHAYALSSKRCL
jgi:hypothetical protein